ncbi:MAG: 3-hydroxyacyl-CoA dehydrogenase family protein [Trueperaceae bacterium]
MSVKPIETITVVGAGTMGGGIAAMCLAAGYRVRLYDPSREALERARKRIAKRDEQAEAEGRLDLHYQLEGAAESCDLLIEAVPERLELKREVFQRADVAAPAHAIFASNTSELSITAMAGATKRPDRVVGMHWFNPPERMKLIEMVRGVHSSREAVEAVAVVAGRCGKTTVLVKDRQGFVTTRALAALLTESMRMFEEGVASKADIDTAVKLGLNHPMGPLELADYVGLDTMLFIGESLTEALGERFRPPQILRKLVEAGRLGCKSGAGFYDYGEAR